MLTLELGRARVSTFFEIEDDVVNDRRVAVPKPIDAADSLIVALVVEAMPPA